jgi:MEMO1 family protein
MSKILAPLRTDLDAMPSPDPEAPGLLLRDQFGYSERVLVVPPQLVRTLSFFDGQATEDDLREYLVRSTGSFDVGEQLRSLVDTLSTSGFLEDEVFFGLRAQAHQAFAEMEVRPPAFAGTAYPECPEDCRRYLDAFLEGAPELPPPPRGRAVGIAAPHASFEGGPECYREAFNALRSLGAREEMKEKIFVVLATSHYGPPERYGVTRKPFVTPFGQSTPANELLDEIQSLAPASLISEDYCHTMEHSAEFHILWLQHLFGADVKVLPVLVGSYARSIFVDQQPPERSPEVAAFCESLRHLDRKYGDKLVWVLSIDMAHMGPRYGDREPVNPDLVAVKDRLRLDALQSGDASKFWSDVLYQQDPLKWCGSACLYTLLQVFPGLHTEALNYGQWNIDEESLVTFGALRFTDMPRIVLS